jgi:hypothetical protein
MIFIVVAPPLHRHSCLGEALIGFTLSPSSAPALIGELWRPMVPGLPCAGDTPSCKSPHRRLVHRGPSRVASPQHHGHSPWDFPLNKILKFIKSRKSYTDPPEFVVNCTAVPECSKIYNMALGFQENNFK